MRLANIARYRFSPSDSCRASFAVLLSVVLLGCSAGGKDKGGGITRGGSDSLNLGGSNNDGGKSGSDGGLVLPLGGNTGPGSSTGPCEGGGWRCKVPDCTGQDPTSIRATVYDPAGVTPL